MVAIDKSLLQQQVLQRLAQDLQHVEQAARQAHETATHEENIAENKYDTLGLEAAYLAQGQARRAQAIRQAIANWQQFRPSVYDPHRGIQIGALVCLADPQGRRQFIFIGPDGGSMQLVQGVEHIQVISAQTPLGCAMLAKGKGDEILLTLQHSQLQFEVLGVI